MRVYPCHTCTCVRAMQCTLQCMLQHSHESHSAIVEWLDGGASDSNDVEVPLRATLLPSLCAAGVLHCGAYLRCGCARAVGVVMSCTDTAQAQCTQRLEAPLMRCAMSTTV